MAAKILPSVDTLRSLLDYNAEDGKLYWKARHRDSFATSRAASIWEVRSEGKEAFTAINNNGYKHGKVHGIGLLAHRVIFCIHHGHWPEDLVDHIDGDRLNNRISNLREASRLENTRNQGVRKTNTSGIKGVDFDKRARKFRAQISVDGKKMFLGYYDTGLEAASAYAEASRAYHGEFSRLK